MRYDFHLPPTRSLLHSAVLACAAFVCALEGATPPGCDPLPLTEADRAAGWELLSVPRAASKWSGGVGKPLPSDAWKFDGACLHLENPRRGGSLFSVERYRDFEADFEWKIATGGNSGFKYMCVPGWRHPDFYPLVFHPLLRLLAASMVVLLLVLWLSHSRRLFFATRWGHRIGLVLTIALAALSLLLAGYAAWVYRDAATIPVGLEYQLIDDDGNRDARAKASHRTAALYDVFPPGPTAVKPPGQFNHSRIHVAGNRVQHWLNGRKVLEYEFGSPALRDAIAHSKFAAIPRLAEKHDGLFELQNHGNQIWFRHLKVRHLNRGSMR